MEHSQLTDNEFDNLVNHVLSVAAQYGDSITWYVNKPRSSQLITYAEHVRNTYGSTDMVLYALTHGAFATAHDLVTYPLDSLG